MAAKKRLCNTCGFRIPTTDTNSEIITTARVVKRTSFWSKFLGVNDEQNQKDASGQEKPALG